MFLRYGACLAILFSAAPLAADEPVSLCHKCDSAEECEPEVEQGGNFETFEALVDTDLQHVDLEIQLDFDAQIVSGVCTLTIKNLVEALDVFTFRLRSNLSITESLINGDTPITIEDVSTTTRRALLDRTYVQDEVFTLTIAYNGSPVDLGFGSFTWDTHDGSPIASTLSEPYYAYTWWPCKDGDVGNGGNNQDKFTLDFWITAPDTMLAPANGVLQSTEELGDGTKRFHWASGYPISTYLVSLAATNYNTWTVDYEHPDGTMPVQFFIYPEDDTTAHRQQWEKVLDMLEAFREPYGEYPFIDEKYGIYEFPFGGGMEHQTMTGQGALTLTNTYEYITAHELAHQWWGDMVTCKKWQDIWLNEGFATFSEALWKELKAGGDIDDYHAHMANRRPSTFGGTVYRYDVSNPNSIFSGTNSYRKGAWVLHMLRRLMGDATFFETLAEYRAAYEYNAATTDDFAAICSSVYGEDLTWYFDQWVYDPGAPTYEWSWQALDLNGSHYLLLYIKQVQQADWGVFSMPIDIRHTVDGNNKTVKVWNDDWTEHYVLKIDAGTPSDVVFDPKNWVLHPPETAVAFVAGPPTVVETSPAPGQQISGGSAPDTLVVTFHADVTTTASDYALVGDVAGPVSLTFAYDSPTHTATLTSSGPLPNDHYTLTVADVVVANDSGMALDGELSDPADPGALPTGDGQPGGSAILCFDVVREPADINNDQAIDDADLALFINVLLGIETDPLLVQNSDLTGDGVADGDDIAPFIADFI